MLVIDGSKKLFAAFRDEPILSDAAESEEKLWIYYDQLLPDTKFFSTLLVSQAKLSPTTRCWESEVRANEDILY